MFIDKNEDVKQEVTVPQQVSLCKNVLSPCNNFCSVAVSTLSGNVCVASGVDDAMLTRATLNAATV